ncbi:MAG: acetyl-CoA carboxylase carboxyltransferase subunit alpha [Verrucomicrobia bacterium RIFCSPHIGHO2_12_FULL_41_10]|nr:MAG: acetyl-CoA carboxylase carboxyltransferase subunit alpha [Verrucomicrobia bacterium RIFCSPHIGHO2_12_FULL_41_10]
MQLNYLDFERPIAELQEKIEELRRVGSGHSVNISSEIKRLEQKREALTRTIFSSLKAEQIVQMARHPLRPYTLDYVAQIFTEFDELQGDRHSSKGTAIVSGIARLEGEPVAVIGHQKGRNTIEKVKRNFGMATPDSFRKALRVMKMAEKFNMPVFTFIDTPGAYPGIGAEERNQSEAIARNLFEMAQLKTPIICTVIGEGCSGGALAIGVGDRVLMLQYSYYSVISPEGCASILWKKADRAAEASEALGLTAERLLEHGLIDEIIAEPLGGAHRNLNATASAVKQHLLMNYNRLKQLPIKTLLDQRYQKLTDVGRD